jgi:hypothetical protein
MNIILVQIKTQATDEAQLLSIKSRIIAAIEDEGFEAEFADEYEESNVPGCLHLEAANDAKFCPECGQGLLRSSSLYR